MLSDEDQNRVWEALGSKNVSLKACPLCQIGRFVLVNGLTAPVIVKNLNGANKMFGEHVIIPCAACYCNHCGFFAQFALNPLGLIDIFKKEDGDGRAPS